MAVENRGASRAVRDMFENERIDQGRIRRMSTEAIKFIAATGKNAASAEQAITVNGTMAVGDRIAAVISTNTVGGNMVWPSDHYRSTVVAINTLNQLTTNHVGESLTVVMMPSTAL